MVRARSRIDAAGTSWSCGATRPATAETAALGLWAIAPRNRVLPMPAWPASSRNWPRPAADVLEPTVGKFEQVVATDEERTANGATWAIHDTEV